MMDLDDAAAWARQHKAAVIGVGAAAVLALLYLRHRAKTHTASDTAGSTGATVNGAGDYLIPYSNSSDPTGQSTDNGAGTLANAITGLTTTLNGLSAPRSTEPVNSAAPHPLDAHQLHMLHVKNKGVKPPLDAHQLHMLHVKNKGIKTRPPSIPKPPTGAHSGQTAQPGGAVSTGPRPVVVVHHRPHRPPTRPTAAAPLAPPRRYAIVPPPSLPERPY
jgi:hypothetical protein